MVESEKSILPLSIYRRRMRPRYRREEPGLIIPAKSHLLAVEDVLRYNQIFPISESCPRSVVLITGRRDVVKIDD